MIALPDARGGDQVFITTTSTFEPIYNQVRTLTDPRGNDLETIWEKEWANHILEAAMGRLREKVQPKHFQIYDCYVLKQWSAREVAGRLGTSIAQVHLVKHRLGKLLREEIHQLESQG